MAHVHEKNSTYFLEQLCTIGACGALGGVAIMLWVLPDGINFLGPQFQKPFGQAWLSPVLWGGAAVVVFVLIRAVAVWFSVGKPTVTHDHDHGHDHGHEQVPGDHEHAHDHDHATCDHAHDHGDGNEHPHEHSQDHGHDHGWAPWRYVVLLLPVGLYFLGLIPSAFSNLGSVNTDFEGSAGTVANKGGEEIHAFLELGRASATEQSRKDYEGRAARVTGQANVTADSRRFGLVRFKISCCAADAVPLKMVIEVPDSTDEGKKFNAQTLANQWVDVAGRLQFRKLRDSEEYVTVLVVDPKDVHKVKQPANPWIY
jgi:hypothetical protein